MSQDTFYCIVGFSSILNQEKCRFVFFLAPFSGSFITGCCEASERCRGGNVRTSNFSSVLTGGSIGARNGPFSQSPLRASDETRCDGSCRETTDTNRVDALMRESFECLEPAPAGDSRDGGCASLVVVGRSGEL